jgi:hypothetical protein
VPVPLKKRVRVRPRRSRPRAKSLAPRANIRLTREELRIGALLYPETDGVPRPVVRGDCVGDDRPCPFTACKYHLYLDVSADTGTLKLNFPELEAWELEQSCALDVADLGGITPEEVGEVMNLTRERIRQVEVRGLLKLRVAERAEPSLGEFHGAGGRIARRRT